MCLVALCLCVQSSFSQISNFRHKQAFPADTIRIDTLSLIPGSVKIYLHNEEVDPSAYFIDELKSLIIIRDTSLKDSIGISYRVLPVYFGNSYKNKPKEIITEGYQSNFKPYIIGGSRNESIFNDNTLHKSGSMSRGILFGNNQNLSVNSTLNLQLSGRIADRYNLLASITDDNIPIQPDGQTQVLQDFDQVFIQISDEKTKIVAGDFQLRKPTGYFLNYFKRTQGAYTETKLGLSEKTSLRVEASASVSKGRFARNAMNGIEGNQGPYRLTGADNELYIIVLAGTEQVYLEGKLMQRGQDKDYIIDYNAAEITFTPNQLITKDSRISVEFQYSEKQYARPLFQTSIMAEKGEDIAYLNVFSENDAKNQPLQQDLSDRERAILTAAGDNLLEAVTSGIDSVAYNNSYVLYALTDSLGFDSVFVYSTDSLLAKYKLTFAAVGMGNGDYVEDGFTANGKKYKWIAPEWIDGNLQKKGSYDPIRLLTTPKKNQMITAGFRKQIAKSTITTEGALSNNDKNTFSSIDNEDNMGLAFKGTYHWKNSIQQVDTTHTGFSKNEHLKTGLEGKVNYEYTGKNFSPIERFRNVEFARDWNIGALKTTTDQHLSEGNFSMNRKGLGKIAIGGKMLQLGKSYSGYAANIATDIQTENNLKAQINGSYLSSQGAVESEFLRHQATISKQLGKFKVYYKDVHERNIQYSSPRDSMSQNSYQFYDWEVGAGTVDTLKKSFTLFYRSRLDKKADDSRLKNMAHAEQYGAMTSFTGKKNNRLNFSISNRKLKIINSELYSQQPENTLLARVDYSFTIKNGFITNSSFYEVGSGLEQRREFIYIEVPAGQGIYVWNDYNGDGVKDLNEFEIAQFNYEANYIRASVQSNNYERTYSNQFSHSIHINPAQVLKKQEGWQKFVKRFSNNTSLRIDRKTMREETANRFNPFADAISDSTLLSLNSMARNILFFNKANPTFGLDYIYQNAHSKNLLSNGVETRKDEYNQIGMRWNFYQAFTFLLDQRIGQKISASDFLSGRNYQIQYFVIDPSISWQQRNTGRFYLKAEYAEKTNKEGIESAIIQKLGVEGTLSSMGKSSLQAEINYYRIRYNGEKNNSLAFDMLEGLAGGNNFTWSASVQRTVAKNLQLNLIYNGRKSEDNNTIHAGGVQVRAIF